MKTYRTKKSTVYEFDGYSHYYGAFVEGAFVGKYIVPNEFVHLVKEGEELEALLAMRKSGAYRISLRGARTVQ